MTFTHNLQAIVSFFIQLFVIFPYNALTTPRHGPLRSPKKISSKSARANDDTNRSNPKMVSDGLHKLCTNKESVSALLAEDPTIAPGDAWKRLYGSYVPTVKNAAVLDRDSKEHSVRAEDLQRIAECGNWGPSQPSELFLKVRTFHPSRERI